MGFGVGSCADGVFEACMGIGERFGDLYLMELWAVVYRGMCMSRYLICILRGYLVLLVCSGRVLGAKFGEIGLGWVVWIVEDALVKAGFGSGTSFWTSGVIFGDDFVSISSGFLLLFALLVVCNLLMIIEDIYLSMKLVPVIVCFT